MADFSWDKRTQQYRWTTGKNRGRFVSRAKVAALMDKYIDQSRERGERIVEALLRGDITLRQFEAGFAQVLKYAHVNSYALGLGGTMRFDNARDKGIIGARLREEYKYLRNFTEAIRDGKLSEAQIRARARQYFSALFPTEAIARGESHERNGFLWERDIRNATESCGDCIEIEARGWVPIGTNPAIGVGRECITNCRCHKIYDSNEAVPMNSSTMLSAPYSFGWIGVGLKTNLRKV